MAEKIVLSAPSGLTLWKELKSAFNQHQSAHCLELLTKVNEMRNNKDPDCMYTDMMKDALIWASQDGFTEAFSKIVEFGINPDHVDVYGNTPIILASERGHIGIVRLLLGKSCDMNRADLETRTALHWSAMNGHKDIVKLLLSHGAMPDKKDKIYGYTPLMLAARQGHDSIVEILLNKKCNPDHVDIHQETALFDAVRNGQLRCVQLLLNAGAKMDKVDQNGRTVLLAAVLWDRVSIVALLVKMNCRLDIPGQTMYVRSNIVHPQAQFFKEHKVFLPIEAALMEGKQEICFILYTAGASRTYLHKYAYDHTYREYMKAMTGNPDMDLMLDWLRDTLKQTRTLGECARITIRQCCGNSHRLNSLDLPSKILNYLNIPEIDVYTKKK